MTASHCLRIAFRAYPLGHQRQVRTLVGADKVRRSAQGKRACLRGLNTAARRGTSVARA